MEPDAFAAGSERLGEGRKRKRTKLRERLVKGTRPVLPQVLGKVGDRLRSDPQQDLAPNSQRLGRIVEAVGAEHGKADGGDALRAADFAQGAASLNEEAETVPE